jgi:RNA-binding protein 5/10
MDHRGYSRSPPRQDYGTPSAPDPKSVPRRDDRYRRHAGDDHNYGGMYDERPPTRQGRHDDGDGSREYSRDRRYNRPRSPSGDRRIRSRSHSRTREAGTPTDTVILEGVPFGPSLEELEDAIFNNSTAVDFPNTRIRVSASRGNRRAFIQFQSVEDATAFMKAHYPKLYVELEQPVDEAPEGYFESILHYARGREDPEKAILPNAGENWACPSVSARHL